MRGHGPVFCRSCGQPIAHGYRRCWCRAIDWASVVAVAAVLFGLAMGYFR